MDSDGVRLVLENDPGETSQLRLKLCHPLPHPGRAGTINRQRLDAMIAKEKTYWQPRDSARQVGIRAAGHDCAGVQRCHSRQQLPRPLTHSR